MHSCSDRPCGRLPRLDFNPRVLACLRPTELPGNGRLRAILEDGQLNYGSERLLETYYNYQLSKPGAATIFVPAYFQHISDLGYNKDRRLVSVPSLRVYSEF